VLTDLYTQRALVWAFANRDFRYPLTARACSVGLVPHPALQPHRSSPRCSVWCSASSPAAGQRRGLVVRGLPFTGLVTWNLFSSLLTCRDAVEVQMASCSRGAVPAWTPILGASIVQLVQVALELVVLILMFCGCATQLDLDLGHPILIGTMLFAQGIGLMLSIIMQGSAIVM